MSVVLLGYILDPDDPPATDADIVNRLLRHLEPGENPNTLIRLTYPLGGRWVLIVDDGRFPWLFNDPCGYRRVFYTQTTSDGCWCASQPGLLAEVLGLEVDPDALAFIRAYMRRDPVYWWPGDSTPYREIRHMQPNHYLDLNEGTSHRFWPCGDIPSRPPEGVVQENAKLLQGLIESASNRFELALSITAGKDTRLLLAASKAIRHQLYYFTMMFWDLNRASPDILVPSRLLSRLGLPHHVIRCPSRMERGFKAIHRRSVTSAHDVYGAIAQGLYHHYPSDKVCMKGTAIPITYHRYRLRLQGRRQKAGENGIDPQSLAWLTMREDEFALAAFDRWLSGTSRTNVDVLDLFFWEDREGNWAAMTQSESDIVHEVFVPYNCRLFLVNMLSIPKSYRSQPAVAIVETLTRHLWPEVLSEPIDPPEQQTIVSIARQFLKRPGCMNWRWLWSQIRRYMAENEAMISVGVGRSQ